MSSTFAIVGSGSLGAFLINEFLTYKAAGAVTTLKIISRSETIKSTNPEWFAKGAELAQVDYTNESSIVAAFKDVDVVISTIGSRVVDQQEALANAAKAAGVKLFVPSEYGVDTESATSGPFLAKKKFSEFLKEIDLQYVKIFTGLWTDYCLSPFLGWKFAEGKVTFGGSGDAKLSFTHRTDVARYIAYVLTRTPPSELAWKVLRIQGELTSFNKIVADYEAKTGKKLEVTRTPREVLAEGAGQGDIIAFLYYEWDVHGGSVGSHLSNDLYPDWNPKSVIDAVA
ncbi:NAD-P-binding protein [Thelephora ganbajun]|uniref:NAD-P-binding protein n=1 Tax=Thelephora ganbajun TaxID=370292 RepID=A0ACB6ZXF6_THEGA|nr:NAD-P-binding protein [Thelephora ganbajun]